MRGKRCDQRRLSRITELPKFNIINELPKLDKINKLSKFHKSKTLPTNRLPKTKSEIVHNVNDSGK